MKFARFSCGGILGIIFRHIKESPRTLAELYIFRDRSLVYKWLHDSVTPFKGLVPGIVTFVMEKSCEPVRLSIRKELEDYVHASGLRPEIVAQLVGTAPFRKFLEDILLLAISMPNAGGHLLKPSPMLRGSYGGASVSFAELALASLVIFGGGIAWNGINHLLGWIYYMGGDGKEPRGIATAVWGLTVAGPIALQLIASSRRDNGPANTADRRGSIVVPALYSLFGVIGSLVFYDSGLRASIEGYNLAYGLQELIIGFLFALAVSVPPLTVIIINGWSTVRFRSAAIAALGCSLLPPLLVTVSVSFTFFIDRPPAQLQPLRGFLAGLMLRAGMYLAARVWNEGGERSKGKIT